MTIFDLVFLSGALTVIVCFIRAAYLVIRRRSSAAARVLRRTGIGASVYFITLIVTSLVQPGGVVALGAPNCFDDFCIAVDSAARLHSIGSVSGEGDFIVVSGRVVSRARGRRQRETDVRGVLMDSLGVRHEVSDRGQQALRALGGGGRSLTDFVEPMSANAFQLVFDVPASARALAFITVHGWFPGALIIGSDGSLFHRPTAVRLPMR